MSVDGGGKLKYLVRSEIFIVYHTNYLNFLAAYNLADTPLPHKQMNTIIVSNYTYLLWMKISLIAPLFFWSCLKGLDYCHFSFFVLIWVRQAPHLCGCIFLFVLTERTVLSFCFYNLKRSEIWDWCATVFGPLRAVTKLLQLFYSCFAWYAKQVKHSFRKLNYHQSQVAVKRNFDGNNQCLSSSCGVEGDMKQQHLSPEIPCHLRKPGPGNTGWNLIMKLKGLFTQDPTEGIITKKTCGAFEAAVIFLHRRSPTSHTGGWHS